MAATTVQTLDGYRALIGRAGFVPVEAEDITGRVAAIRADGALARHRARAGGR